MKVVQQDGIKDCGICCLLSIIRYYGGEVSKEQLREWTNTTKEGVSFYNLIEGAKKIGFEAIGLSGKLDNIDVNNLPCIAHFNVNKNYKHFVVLYQINKKKHQVTLMDPAKGKKNISFSEFNLLSSNNYIFLKPIKKLPILKKKNIIYHNIKILIKKNKSSFLWIFLLTASYFFLNIVVSFHFKYLLESSIHYNISNNLRIFSMFFLSIYLFKNINLFLRSILINKWNTIFDYETTTRTYKQVLLLPYLYYKNRTTGEVVSRFKDLNTLRSFIINCFSVATIDIFSIFLFLFWMIKYEKNLTFLILLFLLLIVFITLCFNKKKKKVLWHLKKEEDSINSYLIQGISNVDTVKGSHLEKRISDKFSLKYKSFLEKVYQFQFLAEFHNFLSNNLKDTIHIWIYGMGSYLVIKEKITLSNLIVFQSFYLYFSNSFYQIINILEEYHSFKIALDRVEELFMIHKDNFQNNYYYLPFECKGDIVIKNLSYKLGSKYLFQNINLTIKQKEKILLCGKSGSGKSTLMKMLMRYVETSYGSISIANIDINHYHLESLRSNITYVCNNEYLFTDTIRNNIILSKEVSEEDFEKVCSICLVDDITKKNLTGYDSLMEENGFNYSNGERQRIILARSILRNSNIYILDEALGSIDVQREKIILKKLFDYLKEKTVIVISHRNNNKKLFDRVLTLEEGIIYESEKL